VDRGTGRTVDLSSIEVRFQTDREWTIGENLDLSIHWPAMLYGVTPLQLMVAGRIIRSAGVDAAVQIIRYEFRTRTLHLRGEEQGSEQRSPVLSS